MKIIDESTMRKMEALFDAGTGIRATARETGLNRDTVQRYYRRYKPTVCPCGKPMTHRGWCSFRVARSPGRQKFLSRHVVIKQATKDKWLSRVNVQVARVRYVELVNRLNVAWRKQATLRENELMGAQAMIAAAKSAIARRCVWQIHDDVLQDVLVEMVSGTIEVSALKNHPVIDRIISKNYGLLLSKRYLRLDDPFGDGGETYSDSIPSDTPLFHYAVVTK